MRQPKDDRDKLIQRMTKTIADLLAAMRRDPAWFDLGPEAAKAAFQAKQVKHEGAAQCFQQGLTLEEAAPCSI